MGKNHGPFGPYVSQSVNSSGLQKLSWLKMMLTIDMTFIDPVDRASAFGIDL